MPDDFEYDIFLRHNHADKPRVRRLAGEPAEACETKLRHRLTTMENNA